MKFRLSALTGGCCRRIRVTVAFTNWEAMRNLVTVRVVPQSAPQVTAKPRGLDLGMGSDR